MDRNPEHIRPAQHSDVPPDRPERKTGVGREATQGTAETTEDHDEEHRSGYGGKGGHPDTSSDQRKDG